MHAKNHRVNSNFQIAHFIAGSCHTPDGAYALLCDQREDRENALKTAEAGRLREQVKRLRASKKLVSDDICEQLEAQADIAELDAMKSTTERCIEAAKEELAFINKCIAELQPLRRFGGLTDHEAHQAAQSDEWKLELIRRAENCFLSSGYLPPELWDTMRMHPAFKSEILPAIDAIKSMVASGQHAKLLAGEPKLRLIGGFK